MDYRVRQQHRSIKPVRHLRCPHQLTPPSNTSLVPAPTGDHLQAESRGPAFRATRMSMAKDRQPAFCLMDELAWEVLSTTVPSMLHPVGLALCGKWCADISAEDGVFDRNSKNQRFAKPSILKEALMKKIALILPVPLLFLLALCLPEPVLAKNGGMGKGGGYSHDGTFYHSHSDRSYSGRDNFKGRGHAYGRMRNGDSGRYASHGHGERHHSKRRWHGSHHWRGHHHSYSHHAGSRNVGGFSSSGSSSSRTYGSSGTSSARYNAGNGGWSGRTRSR